MRKSLVSIFLSFILSVLILSSVFAEDVYVTKYGKRYHKENSRFLKNKEVEKLSREEAEERGYKPSRDFLREEAKQKEIKIKFMIIKKPVNLTGFFMG